MTRRAGFLYRLSGTLDKYAIFDYNGCGAVGPLAAVHNGVHLYSVRPSVFREESGVELIIR